ncbi:Pyoverdine synthetase D [Anopheles sinensis]|uniref:Pyoverdine synthetase D n=1 Tax=Anopheles sinensis TaxID=74873 RepID=A0A084VGD6_ANOSI|nr:Pyoverdine synthetase D [Anopheles sinensis]
MWEHARRTAMNMQISYRGGWNAGSCRAQLHSFLQQRKRLDNKSHQQWPQPASVHCTANRRKAGKDEQVEPPEGSSPLPLGTGGRVYFDTNSVATGLRAVPIMEIAVRLHLTLVSRFFMRNIVSSSSPSSSLVCWCRRPRGSIHRVIRYPCATWALGSDG